MSIALVRSDAICGGIDDERDRPSLAEITTIFAIEASVMPCAEDESHNCRYLPPRFPCGPDGQSSGQHSPQYLEIRAHALRQPPLAKAPRDHEFAARLRVSVR